MLATFLIELCLLALVLVKYSVRHIRIRLIAIMLLFLAVFQLAEYNVCGGMGLHAAEWSRLGFVAITILPVLGLHLVLSIAGKKWKPVVIFSYITAAAWMFVFGFSNAAFSSYECAGNYNIFQMRSPFDTLYMWYYFFWLIAAVAVALYFMHQVSQPRRRALEFMVIGYLLFIGPTAIVMSLKPEAVLGIPSIMCGFAILFALLTTFGVARLEKQIAAEKPDKTKRPTK